jgi:hypothetical protein
MTQDGINRYGTSGSSFFISQKWSKSFVSVLFCQLAPIKGPTQSGGNTYYYISRIFETFRNDAMGTGGRFIHAHEKKTEVKNLLILSL